ncbi:hypothetical protein [Actinomycetospora straminea]|uniref:Uncharacterized protein n=1 Tax=Actinomycetospora straminea TaxID=663607 RepID=A0ABP9FB72_9PSEU|nr:hypothetical protein [Actinomycetospora straminea]MDD7936357.1 hypothetical protein [Actinomycetospora straminea]
MSAGGDGPGPGTGDACAHAAAALIPRACPNGGLTLSPAAVAALADLFRAIDRGRDLGDVADRAARRVLGALERDTPVTPAPRRPGDQTSGGLLAAR